MSTVVLRVDQAFKRACMTLILRNPTDFGAKTLIEAGSYKLLKIRR